MERKGLKQLLFEPELLDQLEPDVNLAATMMALKDHIPKRSKESVRAFIGKIVDQINRMLADDIRRAVTAALNKRNHSPIPSAAALDFKYTINRNLKHYNKELKTIIPERCYFFDRTSRTSKHTIIVDIDQSGSMGESVIYSSIMSCILASMNAIKTRIVAFDTNIVDLTEKSDDPVDEMCRSSLERLGTDYIDIYWIHNPADVERWTPFLAPLVKRGKVRRVGVSNHNLEQIKRAQEILAQGGVKLSAVQNHYSLLYRSSERAGILDYCREQGMDFFAYMVLEQGALSGKYDTAHPLPQGSQRAETYNPLLPQLEKLTAAMAQMGEKYSASVSQIAIAWAIAKGAIPLIGVTKPRHVTEAAAAAGMTLTADEVVQLEQLAADAGVDTRGSWEAPMV